MSHIKRLLILFLFYSASQAVSAACTFKEGNALVNLNFTLPESISFPKDTPNGTVIYSDKKTGTYWATFICTTEEYMGSIDARGQNVRSGIYPIGDTGLAWQLISNLPVLQYPATKIPANKYLSFINVTEGFQLIKIGEIKPGAVIPSGTLGYNVVGTLRLIGISITGTNIVAQSCQTPDRIDVSLGRPTLSSIFDDPAPDYQSFRIPLTNCPLGINKVVYRLVPTATSPIVDSSNGVIALNPQSTAKGMGIRIRNAVDQSFQLEHSVRAGEFTPGTSQYDIKMSAQYYPLPGVKRGDMKPGTANAEIMFFIEYL